VDDVLAVLQEFYREALARLLRHQAGARLIRQYDANNTYQYIINREETHLSWLGAAIVALGGTVDEAGPEPNRSSGATPRSSRWKKTRASRWRSSIGGGRASTRWPTPATRRCWA
jgi:hypothetical protein